MSRQSRSASLITGPSPCLRTTLVAVSAARHRSRRAQDPPAGRLVLGQLRGRRHDAADRRREPVRSARPARRARSVLDVAAGNGNATLAAARRWCDVTSTDYVPVAARVRRARAQAEGHDDRRSRKPTPRTCRSPTRRSTR